MNVEITEVNAGREYISFIIHQDACSCTPCEHSKIRGTKDDPSVCQGGHLDPRCEPHRVHQIDRALIASGAEPLGYKKALDVERQVLDYAKRHVEEKEKAKAAKEAAAKHPLVGRHLELA